MSNEPIISVSGLRGIIGTSLTPTHAVRYACSFAASLPSGPIVLTSDGRASGPMLADAIRSGLVAVGRTCIDAGVAATPTTGILVLQHGAAGGIQISASHNPSEYNGLKLFSKQGRIISALTSAEVLDRYHTTEIRWVDHDQLGETRKLSDTIGRHLSLVCDTVDVERIRAAKFHVLLDANHGAGSSLGEALLSELGCEITVLGGEQDGKFDHQPEPTEENLSGVLASVRSGEAQVGFCQDPDADRLAVIDHAGRYLGEEYTLALCADHILRKRKGAIVTNCSTSRMCEDLAEKYGVPFFRSSVGEANVVDVMLKEDAVIGGEGNGGVIDPRVGWVRDSFVAMAILLDAMATTNSPVSDLTRDLPSYAIHKTRAMLAPEKVKIGLEALQRHFADATASHLDGLRLDWPGQWLLIRASNTEPIVRIIAEAATADQAQRLCDEATRVLTA